MIEIILTSLEYRLRSWLEMASLYLEAAEESQAGDENRLSKFTYASSGRLGKCFIYSHSWVSAGHQERLTSMPLDRIIWLVC